MKRVIVAVAITASFAAPASAQYTQAKRAATNAAAATNRHIEAEQRTDADPASQPRAQQSRQGASQQPAVQQAGKGQRVATAGTRRPQDALNINSPADTVSPPVEIMREVYHYARDGRRDPFASLLAPGSDLRPTLSDLKLTTIIYDSGGRHSLAVLRDVATNEQYRVGLGATLGRMIIAQIHPKSIVFTIDEFGTNRQDSLVLTDPTKVRP
jgi:hypothetical protein